MTRISHQPQLVINADDFGMGPRSNAGIIAAVESGALRSVSLMANTRAFDDAVRFARTAVPEIGVGLHFNLTHARPLTET